MPRHARLSMKLRGVVIRITKPLARLKTALLYEQCERCGKWQRSGARMIGAEAMVLDGPSPYKHELNTGFHHDIWLCNDCKALSAWLGREYWREMEERGELSVY